MTGVGGGALRAGFCRIEGRAGRQRTGGRSLLSWKPGNGDWSRVWGEGRIRTQRGTISRYIWNTPRHDARRARQTRTDGLQQRCLHGNQRRALGEGKGFASPLPNGKPFGGISEIQRARHEGTGTKKAQKRDPAKISGPCASRSPTSWTTHPRGLSRGSDDANRAQHDDVTGRLRSAFSTIERRAVPLGTRDDRCGWRGLAKARTAASECRGRLRYRASVGARGADDR